MIKVAEQPASCPYATESWRLYLTSYASDRLYYSIFPTVQAVLAVVHSNAAGDVPSTACAILESIGGLPLVGSRLGVPLSVPVMLVQLW